MKMFNEAGQAVYFNRVMKNGREQFVVQGLKYSGSPWGLDLRGFFFCPLLFSNGKNFICAAFWYLDLELYRLHIKSTGGLPCGLRSYAKKKDAERPRGGSFGVLFAVTVRKAPLWFWLQPCRQRSGCGSTGTVSRLRWSWLQTDRQDPRRQIRGRRAWPAT